MPDLLEREELLAQLDSALGKGGRLVFIAGEAGVGKTSLARRFLEEQPDSVRVLWGACDALFTPRALGPFLEVAEITGGKVEELVRSGAMPHEVTAALIRELETTPTILVLEDVHWADEATLDVVRPLGRRIGAVPALVLVTYRSDELENDHPLRIVLGELVSSEAVRRLTIERLSPAAVAKLAEPHGIDAKELYRKTAGNPFFVTEALAAEADEIPDTVRDAVLARAARLGPEAKTLLEAVAVVPPQAEFWLLEALAGEAVSRLDECDIGHAHIRAARGGVPARARAPCRPGVGCTQPKGRPAPESAWRARRPTERRPRSGPARPPCRSRRRRRRGSPLRARRGRPRGLLRRTPRGRRPVRTRTPLR